MASIEYTATASLTAAGITPLAANYPTLTEIITNSLSRNGLTATDCVENIHTVGPATAAEALDLGQITTGKALWIESKTDIIVTLQQNLGAGPVENKVKGTFLYLLGEYTAVKVENAGTEPIQISVTRIGDRTAGSGAGVY